MSHSPLQNQLDLTILLKFVYSSLYIHGGRDLKEGSIDTMWRVNLTGIHALKHDPYHPVEWECVTTTGKAPGKISHHTCCVLNPKEVLFYGGLKGDDSNAEIFIYNALSSSWNTILLAVSNSLFSSNAANRLFIAIM